jgi:hypothetical protein
MLRIESIHHKGMMNKAMIDWFNPKHVATEKYKLCLTEELSFTFYLFITQRDVLSASDCVYKEGLFCRTEGPFKPHQYTILD